MNQGALILFAQAQQKPPNVADPAEVFAFLAANILILVGILACIAIVWIALTVPFSMSMSKALNRVSEGNRQMAPGLAWLFVIPCLHAIWLFFIVIQVPASLQKEFQDKGMDDGSNYGKSMGLTAAILIAIATALWCIPYAGCCFQVVGLVGLVFWIIFWVQVAGYSAKLAGGKSGRSSAADDDE